MNVDICGMMQETDFTTGDVGDFLILQLPTGQRVKALVTNEVAQVVLACVVGKTPSPTLAPSLEEPIVFGGLDVVEPTSPPPKQPARVRTVVKDDQGYPIVVMAGTADPSSVVGGQATDEDEAGQI